MSLWWLTPEGSKALAAENLALDERYEREMEYRARVEPIANDIERKDGLLREALDAMLNLAPRIKNDRGGCFGDGGQDCECTACRIRRELAE